MTTIYLASPTGFSPEHRPYRERVKAHLRQQGHVVADPWDHDYGIQFAYLCSLQNWKQRMEMTDSLRRLIGRTNRFDIMRSDVVLGILDGTEPDSGTVAEVCFAAGTGKRVYGLRTDFRDAGEMPGVALNLQVLDFVEESGGKLFRSVEEVIIP